MRKLLFFLIVLSIQPVVHAQHFGVEHPIDSIYIACINGEDQSTHGMLQCASKAYDAWFSEVNASFLMLLNISDENEKILLQKAQQDWETFIRSEFDYSNTMHQNMAGSMYKLFDADIMVQLVKQRAMQLRLYLDTKQME